MGSQSPIYVLARDVLLTESGCKPFLVDRLATPTPFYPGLLALSTFSLWGHPRVSPLVNFFT